MLHAARWKCRTQKIAKNSLSAHHCTTLLSYIFAIKACINNRKKLVKQQYLIHMSSKYVELLVAEIVWRVCGTLANFNAFRKRVLASLLKRRCWTEVNQTLHCVWLSLGLVHYVYISLAVAPDGILPGLLCIHFWELLPQTEFCQLQNSLCVQVLRSAWHSSSKRQLKFAACYKEWNYRTFARAPLIFIRVDIMLSISPHSSYY